MKLQNKSVNKITDFLINYFNLKNYRFGSFGFIKNGWNDEI